ncbi:MAG: insulinase family protein, partial [Alistipes sp.]|nr:insulinase family protein [Alistipes sp.]
GAKNDPIETTGLAHYFEHLMFKGTEQFGTQDYAAEKPMLDEIERLFEIYRTKTDPAERKALYAQIDSVSQEAAKLAIPNEYDKLMAAIGASGTNAWTSFDETVYTENIPSNQVENWAKIQSDRFANSVIRGFHTELETVYEEYNMSLTRDGNKAYYGLMELLFPNHPYGQHTVLGFQDHLKNPSITNIKNYYKTYYVPNNMAICLSGDFDPEKTIAIIDKYFGSLAPNPEIPEFSAPAEQALTAPATKEVFGNEAEFVYIGWRTEGGAATDDAEMASLVGSILSNGKCGLIDVDLAQQQKILYAGAFDLMMPDRGGIVAAGYPKEGQSLDEVKDLILGEIAKLRNGEFDEELLSSTISNYKLGQMRTLDSNRGRAMAFVDSFINGTDWADEVTSLDRLGKITKEDVVAWANKTLGDDNYVVLYKRMGEDKDQKKIDKPAITPIVTNRDCTSDFLVEIQQSEVEPIAPVFVDFEKDMSITRMSGRDVEVLYKKNETNDLFTMIYLYDFGSNDDPAMDIATTYIDLLGTDSKSLQEIQSEFYSLACSFGMSVAPERVYVVVSGLGENMERALALAEEYMANLQGDDEILAELKRDIVKERNDSKLNQSANFSALRTFATYGPEEVAATTLTDAQLAALTSDELIGRIKNLPNLAHRVMYYGPLSEKALVAELDKTHHVAEELQPVEKTVYYPLPTPESKVFAAQYDAKQIYYTQHTTLDRTFSTDNDAVIELYNSYFGGGMNAIVFQEMREARALAYSAYAVLGTRSHADDPYTYMAFIATQNDKMRTAIEAFDEIIENMPESEAAFELAKQQLLGNLATQRTIKEQVLWAYISALGKGVDFDRDKGVYEKVQNMTIEDVKAFQQEWIKNRKYVYCVLGDLKDIDMDYLKTLGPVQIVSQSEMFGY